MAMTKEHKNILQVNHVTIMENLILSEEFISMLMTDGVLTASLKELVESKKTRSERVRELMLFTLPRRGDLAYTIFIQALVESRQDHLAICLDKSTAEQYIEERDQAESERPSSVQVEVQPSFNVHFQPEPQLDETDTAWYEMLFKKDTEDLGVPLKQMTLDRQEKIKKLANSKKAYPVKKKDGLFGRAVIISNSFYYNLNPRPGSDVDCEHLRKLFEQLHYETHVHKDLTAEEMRKTLTDERNNGKHAEYSSFVVCILAHGCENKVYGVDGRDNEGTIEISEMTSWFSSVNCPGLAGKPKLFFIQACQGGKDMLAATLNKLQVSSRSDASHDGPSGEGSQARVVKVDHSLPQSDARPAAASQQPMSGNSSACTLQTPEVADVLVAYSTAPGYKSWRHPEFGTWFIRCLIYVILNNACEEHILDMLTEVAFIISHFKVEKGNSYAVQIPQIVSTLRRKVYFMP